MQMEALAIDRKATGLRFLFTLLFLLIAEVLETVLVVVILFELFYALLTRAQPPDQVRQFANRAVAYFYRIGRYLTYNEVERPFPFTDFPPEVEAPEALEEEDAEWEPE